METHILFFILASVLIVILIGYSIWSARREKSRVFSNTFSTRIPSTPVKNESNISIPTTLNPTPSAHSTVEVEQEFDPQEVEKSVGNITIRLAEQAPPTLEQSGYTLQNERPIPLEEPASVEEAVQEPVIAQQEPEESSTGRMITLYVVAAEGQHFSGDKIRQALNNIGAKHGDYDIFHWHLDNTFDAPAIFSIANMLQPGVFDLNQMERLSTAGLIFFMRLPSVGNDVANLRLMLRAAESVANDLQGFVLDEEYNLFDDNARQSYFLKLAQPQ